MLFCTTVPKMAFNYLSGRNFISLAGCGTQIFIYMSLLGAKIFLLTVMAYDCYVTICHQLWYIILMSQKLCKAFATCSSHLSVVGLYYGAVMFIYMRPVSTHTARAGQDGVGLLHHPNPRLSPLIYSLHNWEVSRAPRKLLRTGNLT
ncbi:Olfactory receptor 2M4 [Sciurus carolinensis]|uniref:Olfactory receptor 2M4 n=1 Tax=Sciurus carolinensis TaxID=30640 RepID=A0AA41NC05_SCICA|nr:Olfactory receptor 2M4 [Sciurus carolinensis]